MPATNTRSLGPALVLMAACLSDVALAETGPLAAPVPLAEEEFLDILPKLMVPESLEPIPGAVNEEFRNCREYWPAEYETSQNGPEARAYRDVYGFVQARNVITQMDCSCTTKSARWDQVEAIAAVLRRKYGVSALTWKETKAINAEANRLVQAAEAMCGGRF